MSAKAILRASTGDTIKLREEIEKKYDNILEDNDIIVLADAVAIHLLGNIMDPKIHNNKMKAEGGWAEHLRKKGMLPEDLEDVFGENMTPPVATTPPITEANPTTIEAIKKATIGDTTLIRAEIENEYKEELGSNDRIILANAISIHLFNNTMDPEVHAAKVQTDGGWAEHLRKKGMLPVALEDVFGANMTPPPPAPPTPPPVAEPEPANIEAIKRATIGDSRLIRAEIEDEYKEELGSNDRIILANSVANHLFANTMDPEVHAAKVKADGGWAEHLRKKGMLPVALEDVFGANMALATTPADATTGMTHDVMMDNMPTTPTPSSTTPADATTGMTHDVMMDNMPTTPTPSSTTPADATTGMTHDVMMDNMPTTPTPSSTTPADATTSMTHDVMMDNMPTTPTPSSTTPADATTGMTHDVMMDNMPTTPTPSSTTPADATTSMTHDVMMDNMPAELFPTMAMAHEKTLYQLV